VNPTMQGAYDYRLVALSVLIAICASYAALRLGARTAAARGGGRIAWLAGGAIAMGFGIWSMHYVGMLAFTLPVPVRYDLPTVIVSLLAAMIASGVALFVVSRDRVTGLNLGFGGLFMGSAIVAMHYIGMAAMRLPGMCHYDPGMLALSGLIAAAGSYAALWLTFRLRAQDKGGLLKISGAVAMGFAIAAMHYTGMAAASFTRSGEAVDYSHAVTVSSLGIAGIVIVTFLLLGFAVFTSIADQQITAHRRLAEELYLSRQMLQSILDNVPQRVFWLDRDNRYLGCNRAFAKDAGLENPEDVAGKTDADLFPDERLRPFSSDLRAVLETRRAVLNSEYRLSDVGGERWLRASSIPLYDRDGQVFGVLGTYEDVTEHKAGEEAIKRSNVALSEFAHIVSHDLQAPLGLANKFAQLLVRRYGDRLDETAREFLRFIEDNLIYMSELTQSLLKYATATQPEPGGQQQVSLENALQRALLNLQLPIEEAKAQVTWDGLPTILGYPAQIVQILQNLVSNAIKYRKHDGVPHVHVSAKDNGDEWIIAVEDNGIGISQENWMRIFGPLKRLHGRDIPGSGIGLATCRKIVEWHGGKIWVESELGVGSRFYFTVRKHLETPPEKSVVRQHQSPVLAN